MAMSSAAAAHGLASLYAAMLPPPPPSEPATDVEAIADDAYRAGFAAGTAQAEAGLQPERAMLKTAAAAVIAATVVDPDALRGVFLTLVRALAEAVVAGELRQNPEAMPRLVDAALASVATRDGVVLRVHAGDAMLLSLDIPVVVDPTLARGEVYIDGPDFVVRDGLNARLEALIEAVL